jgi:hypothetical protein
LPPEDNANNLEKNNFKAIMPRSWTPKMYLGALNQSIRKNYVLTLESINISGRNYTTMHQVGCPP